MKQVIFTSILSLGVLAFGADTHAQDIAFEEVMAVHKILQAEGCDYVYLSMGERQLFKTDNGYEAEAECEDGKVYDFKVDKDHQLIEKTEKAE